MSQPRQAQVLGPADDVEANGLLVLVPRRSDHARHKRETREKTQHSGQEVVSGLLMRKNQLVERIGNVHPQFRVDLRWCGIETVEVSQATAVRQLLELCDEPK